MTTSNNDQQAGRPPTPSDVAGDGNGSDGGLQDQSNSVWKDVFPMIPAAARLVRPHVQPSYPTRAACEEDVLVKLVEQNYSWPPVEKTRPGRVQRFFKRCIFNYLFTHSTSDNTVTMTEQTTVITGKKSTSTNILQKDPSSALPTAKTPATLSSAQIPSTPATVRVLASPSTAKTPATPSAAGLLTTPSIDKTSPTISTVKPSSTVRPLTPISTAKTPLPQSNPESSASAGVEVSAPSDAEAPPVVTQNTSPDSEISASTGVEAPPVVTQNTSPDSEVSASTGVEVSAPSDAETPTGRVEVNANEYRQIMRQVCADELCGIQCRTKSSCEKGFRVCPEFGNNKISIKALVKCPTDHSKMCPFTSFSHGNFVHIRKTCHSVLKNEECQYPSKHNGEPCPFGHDNESLRRLIWAWRKELAVDNRMEAQDRTLNAQSKRGPLTHQSGARKRAKKQHKKSNA